MQSLRSKSGSELSGSFDEDSIVDEYNELQLNPYQKVQEARIHVHT
jgi:hypothetical protein